MGLFNTFFSRSSERGSRRTSENGPSWTWTSNRQSGDVAPPPSPDLACNERGTAVPNATNDDHISKCQVRDRAILHCHLEQIPASEDTSRDGKRIEGDPHQSSSDHIHSMRGSRGIAGFMASIRSRRARHRKSLKHLWKSAQDETSMAQDDENRSKSNNGCMNSQLASRLNIAEDGGPEPRKVSDKTLESVRSDHTAETVCRHPSRSTPAPVAIVERESVYENPFEEIPESLQSGSCSNPFTDQSRPTTHSSRESSSDYSFTNSQVLQSLNVHKRPRNYTVGTDLDIVGSLSRESSIPISCLNEGSWADFFDRRKTAMAYNELATELGMEPLPLGDDDGDVNSNCGHAHPIPAEETYSEELPRRRDRIIRRIRTMRSTLHVKAQNTPQERTLRRMKTFANLPSHSYGMDSLSGMRLEGLARLGGHSFLALPGDFAPTALKLPVCFVATATYLRCRGPLVHGLFFDPGDIETAIRMYRCFADQVLSAEKEQDTIEMTMRGSEMPSELAGILYSNTAHKDLTLTLSVGWVYRCLLAGLPGGILGSERLYHTLLDIYKKRFSKYELKRTRSCLGGLSQVNYARIKAISLAIVSLASSMQLELMCAVFGLCAVLLHETGRLTDSERRKLGAKPQSRWMLLTRLGQAFGPLLTDQGYEYSLLSAESLRAIEISRLRVAMMLIANWRGVSRQLRVWENEVRGPERLTISWSSSGEAEDSRG